MVVGAFPVAKLGVLAMKQISKPIANILKTRAKNSEFFRTYICMPPAQFYNWMEIKTKMWAMNLGKPVNVPPLNEAMAIDLGANLLGECVIFVIGAGLLLLEYNRQVRKESMKEAMVEQEKAELVSTLNEIKFRVERQDTQIRELERVLADIESRSWVPKKLLADLKLMKSASAPAGQSFHELAPEPEGNYRAAAVAVTEEASEYSALPQSALFRGLGLIETEVFSRTQTPTDDEERQLFLRAADPEIGIVTKSLVYLVGYERNGHSS